MRTIARFTWRLFACGMLTTASMVPAPASGAPPRLPGTGQTNHYTQTFGEDADFSGRGPAYVDNGDGTVTDKITGLMWQKTDGGEMTWEKAKDYARNLKLAGHQDWRLPSSMELFAVVNHEKNRPAMDTAYFTRTEAEYWWTDSTRADGPSRVWVVNGGGGIGAHPKNQTTSEGGERPYHVRCVRGAPSSGTGPSLKVNADGTVTDAKTGLVWQQIGADAPMTWEEALKYCSGLKLAGQDDWRLPNIKELRSLSDDRKMEPSLDKTCFPKAQAEFYWSSTSQCNFASRAWYVDFATGLVTYAEKPERHFVLAVRGGGVVAGPKVKPVPDPKLLRAPGGGRGGKDKDDRKKEKGRGDKRPQP